MPTTVHIGVGARFVSNQIRSVGNKGFVMKGDQVLPDRAALAWVTRQIRKGVKVFAACPTPEPDGHCPGHKEGGNHAV